MTPTKKNQRTTAPFSTKEAARSIALREARRRDVTAASRVVTGALTVPIAAATSRSPARAKLSVAVAVPQVDDPTKALDAVIRALGFKGEPSGEEILAAVEALIATKAARSPAAIEATARRLGLSEREAKLLASVKGADPKAYLAAKIASRRR